LLWDVHAEENQFVCRVWGLTPEEVTALSESHDAVLLHDKTPEIGEFYDLARLYEFLAGEDDPMPVTNALALIKRIEPGWNEE